MDLCGDYMDVIIFYVIQIILLLVQVPGLMHKNSFSYLATGFIVGIIFSETLKIIMDKNND
jgi:uncharacterized membrane protein